MTLQSGRMDCAIAHVPSRAPTDESNVGDRRDSSESVQGLSVLITARWPQQSRAEATKQKTASPATLEVDKTVCHLDTRLSAAEQRGGPNAPRSIR